MNRRKRLQITEEERNTRIEVIEEKWKTKIPLTEEDKIFAIDHLKYEKLLFYPFGVDEFFVRTFFGLFENMTTMQEIAYTHLVREWENDVNKTNHADPILQTTAQETREELKKLRNDFTIAIFNYTSQQYNNDKFNLLAWSKYRYLISKRVIENEFKGNTYKLSLNGIEIIMDQQSIAHIFARHYGQTMKPYISDKSHFSKDFYHEEIHLDIQEIFSKINESGIYVHDSIEEITFRYNGTIYRIYCKPAKKSVKGTKGPVEFIRLVTFFPLEDKKMLASLQANYRDQNIDNELSVFILNVK